MSKITKTDIKRIYDKHKKAIAGTAIIVGSAITWVLVSKAGVKPVKIENVFKVDKLPIEKLPVGDLLESPWHEGDFTNMIVNDLKIKDCGAFGDGLKQVFEGLTDDNTISVIVGMDGIYSAK